MKKLMLTASILFASSTAANAWPWQWRGDVVIHSNNDEGYRRGDQYYGNTVVLARRFAASSDRQFVNVLSGARFHRLRIEAVRGTPFIHKVAVEFRDHHLQLIQIERPLGARGDRDFVSELDDGAINRIVVYTEPTEFARYSIYGEGAY